MGFFSEIASEARRSGNASIPPATPEFSGQQTVFARKPPLDPAPVTSKPEPLPANPAPATPESSQMAPEPKPVSAVEPENPPRAISVPDATPEPEPRPEPASASEPPAIDLTPTADAADDAERRKAHEAAEAKRKAEFDAKQAEKTAARQKQLDHIAAMSDEEIANDAVKRVGADTEKLTRRNMKEAVCEHIQTVCRQNPTFARRTMLPEKSMLNCFQYINRKAREYAEQEMKYNGIERTGTYGCDVPDGLCYQWAVDYFNADDVKEDHKDDEKFVPKPYIPATRKKAQGKTDKKPSGTAQSRAGKASAAPGDSMEQMSLM